MEMIGLQMFLLERLCLLIFERSVLDVDKMMMLEEKDKVRHMLQYAKSKA